MSNRGTPNAAAGQSNPRLSPQGELTDRLRRVLVRLLEEHRWPDRGQLHRLLPPHVGAVLAAYPLSRYERVAKIRVAGAAVTYCWNYLPDVRWRLVDPPPGSQPGGHAPPLCWSGRAGVVVDWVHCGVHRRLDDVLAGVWVWGQRWAATQGRPLVAVRVLPLAQLPEARLVTAGGVQPLAGSALADMGGVWR